MKDFLKRFIGQQGDAHSSVNLENWFKSFTSISRHLLLTSPSMNFESSLRHFAEGICHALAPLQPVAVHFHVDVSISHLWLPDPSFKLDIFYRLQNRILMPSHTKPVETLRDDLHQTYITVPYDMHKHSVEIVIYHKDDPSGPVPAIVSSIVESFSLAVSQSLSYREEHMDLREQWKRQVEKGFSTRLAAAVHQAQSSFMHAQSLRGFTMASAADSSEQIFLSHNQSLDLLRFVLLKNKAQDTQTSALRICAFVTGLAAQLRFFEHTTATTSFPDFLQYFSHSITSLNHLLTEDDELSFVVGELAQKTGVTRWHSTGIPSPSGFGKGSDSLNIPSPLTEKGFKISASHDWTQIVQMTLPPGTGLFFLSKNVLKRLTELNLDFQTFTDRLRSAENASDIILEAERLLSKPDSSRVVSASVTDWNQLPYDISMLSLFNASRPSVMS